MIKFESWCNLMVCAGKCLVLRRQVRVRSDVSTCSVVWPAVRRRGVAGGGDVVWRGAALRGVAWRGVAWVGVAWVGVARRGPARRGVVAWRGVARRGVGWVRSG